MQFTWFGFGAVPIRRLGDVPRRARLPAQLVALASHLERKSVFGSDLAVACDDVVAHRLTDALWRRARELAAEGRLAVPLPADVAQLGRDLSPAAVVEVLATVISAGFAYDPRAAATGWFARLGHRVRRVRSALAGDVIEIASRSTAPLASPVVCLEFATAMRVLFYALKRATGALENVFVPVVFGGAFDIAGPGGHAWNWLVDARAGAVAAFDVTSLASNRQPIHEIDLARYRNVSAFLGSVYALAWSSDPPIGLDDIGELLQATIEPETERGLVLLYHLADHPGIPLSAGRRIAAHLGACELQRVLPEWRERLSQRERALGRIGRLVLEGDDHTRSPLEWVALRPDLYA
jgi:hypothetical protein